LPRRIASRFGTPTFIAHKRKTRGVPKAADAFARASRQSNPPARGVRPEGAPNAHPNRQTTPTPMKRQTLKDLYVHELKTLYSAEQQILEALPKMIQATANAQLAAAFQAHLEQTREQADRLEKILERHDQTTRGPRYKGMEGVLAEGAELLDSEADEGVRDAGLIAAAQRVEHDEIAGYGSARTYAEMLGDAEGARLLQATLTEETETDQKLTDLAKSVINLVATK
jgi:ferritin-like metal-binding protein YciE